ncbi:MAG: ATP-dependent zinc metalloprotease FtsH [Verrucomicrobiales bacterium]|nr:ATP-dependent zinc metalloprotease FtsH [Verrucomicrobiales bacterium]
MQDKEPNDNDQRPGGESGFNWKGLILLFVAMGLFGLAIWSKSFSDASKMLSFGEFKTMVENDRIYVDEGATPPKLLSLVQKDGSSKQFIEGWYEVDNAEENGGNKYRAFSTPIILEYAGEDLKQILAAKELEISNLPTTSDGVGVMLLSFYLPVIFLLLLLYFLFRHQIKAAGKGAMSFGKSKAKMMTMDKGKVTFKDVAGVEEAKEEVWEIVEYLRDPKQFQRLGGRIPKGVLMVGSPGTGKTLLARAIAGEADVPFFSISGSDFVEMFVGVGASRVRDMFEQGKKNAPCLIFIDEIDAVGRHRGHGMGGGHDEREQTLNALLVEMDGFDTQEGVIIIAATNRPDVLDPALLRPGRFDREITVSLPDVKGREEILSVHAKKVKLAEGVDLGIIARGTPGYSGAELANVINEAALLAARKGLKAIHTEELEEARDKVRWGKERRSLALSEDEKQLTAYHEAGHALLGMLVKDTDPVHKVSIIPRGPALGVTMYLPVEDKHSYKKQYLLDRLVLIMGGRVAEELVFGDVTNGAAGDIRQASEIARKMVCNWGMSDRLGMIEYGEGQGEVFLARDISTPRNYSEATAQTIDDEVKKLTDEAYEEATRLLKEHRDKLEAIAQALLVYETLDGVHVQEIMDHGEIQNPPSAPTPPDLPGEDEVEPVARVKEEEKDKGEDFPGELAPA